MSDLGARSYLRPRPGYVIVACAAITILCGAIAAPPSLILGQTPAEFAQRRERLRSALDGILLVPSSVTTTDRERFRADNDLVYLTGLELSSGMLALLPNGAEGDAKVLLFVNRRWGGPTLDRVKEDSGLSDVYDYREAWERLKPIIGRIPKVYVAGSRADRTAMEPDGGLEAYVRAQQPDGRVLNGNPLIHNLRVVKSDGEIANIKAAVRATVEGMRRGAARIRPGTSELSVEGAVLAGFREGNAPREAFPCIVGAGPNSVDLHHDPTERSMRSGETVVVDIGAEVHYYAADITRTFPVGGRFSPRARELYNAVLQVQRDCEQYVKPGKTTWGELDSYARAQLRQSRLRGTTSSNDLATLDRFLTHYIGHYIGMDVHDVGQSASPIPVGSVLAIEPGVYIPAENIGIRIEDNYLVTETGLVRLSEALPRDADDIERMVRRR